MVGLLNSMGKQVKMERFGYQDSVIDIGRFGKGGKGES